jgi:hypothetical protein
MLIPGQKPQILESVSVCVATQLKETGLYSGTAVVYVLLCVEETREQKTNKYKTRQIFHNKTAKNFHETTYCAYLNATTAVVRRTFHAENFLKSSSKETCTGKYIVKYTQFNYVITNEHVCS